MIRRLPSITFLLAAFLPALALPPAPFAGGEWLMLPGLIAWYALVTAPERADGRRRRPLLGSYVLGVVQMLWFSWSLRFLTIPGYLAIGFAGGLYFVLAAAVTRAPVLPGGRFGRFALAVAAVHWLRAHLPEIWYPHGQPIHALYEHPELLGIVRWAGEAAGNFVLALWAAALVDAWRSWQRAEIPRRVALTNVGGALALWALPCVLHPPETRGEEREVDVLLVEPGFDFERYLRGERTSRFLIVPALLASQRDAGALAQDPPDLVVWPESAFPFKATPAFRDYSAGLATRPALIREFLAQGLRPEIRLADGVRVVAGAEHVLPDGGGRRGVTVLLDHDGLYLGHQEKLHPVPGGERLPFIDLLPRAWADKLVESVSVVNTAPDLGAGMVRPPLETADGVKFSALLCFDNAFDDVARIAARAGSEFCVVASNEAWYRQGGELPQMVAMTVCRALETGLPWVRSTVDGRTMAIDRDGRVTASLGPADPGGPPRSLRTSVRASSRESLATFLQAIFGPASVVFALAFLVVGWFRRRSSGTAERSSESNP